LAILALALGHILKGQIEARALSGAEDFAVLVAQAGVQPNLTPTDLSDGMTPERITEFDQRLHLSVFGEARVKRVKLFNERARMI